MITIFSGGTSSEREISLQSGQDIYKALLKKGYAVESLDYSLDQMSSWNREKCQLVIIALHGGDGENGAVQDLLEKKNIPFTSSSAKTCQLFFDKVAGKKIFESVQIQTPLCELIDLNKGIPAKHSLPFPCIVKPPSQGSSFGVSLVFNEEEYRKALKTVATYDDIAMVEEFVVGREMTVSCVGSQKLVPIEIISTESFFDTQSKYTSPETQYICDPLLADDEKKNIDTMLQTLLNSIDLKGFFRVDFILSRGVPFVLEVNTVPGLTRRSLLPQAYCYDGNTFEDLCVAIVENGLKIV